MVIEVDDNAAGSAILNRGLEEAQRRHARVKVLTPARTYADMQAHWERRLAESRRRFSDLEIASVSNHGDTLDYLAANADSIQLLVTGRRRPGGLAVLVGAPGNAALRDSDCSILVCGPHTAL